MLVGEPVPATAQLPCQHPLAEPLTPRSGVLIDDAGSMQQSGLRLGAAMIISAGGLRPGQGEGGMRLPISDGGAPARSKYPAGIRLPSEAGEV